MNKSLRFHSWAERIKQQMALTSRPIHLTTLVIICEGLLGLSWQNAIRVSKAELHDNGLPAQLRKLRNSEKHAAEPLDFLCPGWTNAYREVKL